MFQNHEAEQPMAMVIRQDIYEDLTGIRIGVGYRLCVGRFPCILGNSVAGWRRTNRGPECWKRGVSLETGKWEKVRCRSCM